MAGIFIKLPKCGRNERMGHGSEIVSMSAAIQGGLVSKPILAEYYHFYLM